MQKWATCSLIALTLLLPVSGRAETPSDYETCKDEEGNTDDRIRACTRILTDTALAPNQSDAYRNRGAAYLDRRQYDLAISDESKAINLNSQDAIAYNLRAWAHFKSGDPRKALPDVDKALSINPNLSDALDTRGHINEILGMKKEAIQDYKKALSIDPELDESKDGLGRLGVQ